MIFVTGDMHGSAERMKSTITELRNRSEQDALLLVCGDFGYVMLNDRTEHALLDEIAKLPVTIAFCDGNHENFDYLDSLPVQQWHGGSVHAVRHNILHLMRGQMYEIEGHSFFVMGGAASTDRAFRLTYQTMYGHQIWWKQELPATDDYRTAGKTLEHCGYSVDYVLTHTAPQRIICQMGYSPDIRDQELCGYLDWLNDTLRFRHWYFGHFHEDRTVDDRHTCLNQRLIALGETIAGSPESQKSG
jgi:predicted phosphodiesterase